MLLIYSRRTRPMQMAVIALIIVTQVVGPVLNSYTSANYFEAQAAKAATAKDNQAEAQSDRAMREKLGKVAFNPRLSPLNSGKQSPEITSASFATGLQAPASSLHAAPASQAMTSDTGLDTDGDGLTDFVEERIGTSSVISDTDSDGLNDKIEVNGFLFGGQRWYTNPEVADSNGDGLGDALEWGLNADGSLRTTLLDSDGDGFPDLFDLDNDGDGVPDNKDLSPFAKGGAAYSEATPLQLIVNNLTAGKPTFVEFQIRPQDEKQLWFAYNVLDWPQDSAGQMRDVDGKTYADVAANSRLTPVASETNGDMKAVPMLEIRMPAASANLPPQEELTPFNISINNLSADGQTKVAYVPLSIVTDEKTGQRVAFSGQMRYLPTGSWLSAHQVRLAWVVQALVDMPCDPADSAQVAQGCQADGYIHNVAQPIHTYYGNWSLTGLAVREDHGASMALVYEDPAVDDKPKSDDALWALSFVLDHHFVLGRDDNGDGRRDLTLDDMATRFDRDNNPSEAQRMDVPNILQVEKQSYPTLNQAVAFTAMTETVKILNNVFKPLVTADRTRKPLLLFAQENTMRALTLDAVGSGGYVVQNGGALTLDLAPANQPAQTASVTAGLKWMAYCAPATGDVTFQPCAPDQYWDELDTRYASLPLEAGETDPLLGFGRLMMAQLYYMGFSTGYQGTVQDGQRILSGVYSLQGEDTTATSVRASLRSLAAVPLLADRSFGRLLSVYRISNSKMTQTFGSFYANVVKPLEGAKLKNLSKLQLTELVRNQNFRFVARVGPLATVGAVLIVITQIVSMLPDLPPTARAIVGSLSIALTIGLSIVMPIVEASFYLRAGASTGLSLLTQTFKITTSTRIAGIVGLAISTLVIWGFFFYAMGAGSLKAGDPALNRAFFEAVAATVVAVLLTILASNPVGLLIGAIIGVIDLILTLICELGVKELRKVPGLDGACFTLTGAATKVLAKLLYNYDLMHQTQVKEIDPLSRVAATFFSNKRWDVCV